MILKKLFKFRERKSPTENEPAPDDPHRDLTAEEEADLAHHRELEEEGLVKPFLEHLEDLRTMFMKIVITLVVVMIGAFIFRAEIIAFLQLPLDEAAAGLDIEVTLVSLDVPESMTLSFKLAFFSGLIISFPLILFYLSEFIFPGLTKREKRYVMPALAIGGGLFLIGVIFSFELVLPAALDFFHRDAEKLGINPQWTIKSYYSFVTQLCLAFGLSFELPVVILVLVKLELLTFQLMQSTRAYAVIAIFFVSAIITPTTDILTLLALAGPLLILYEICIWLAFFIERKRPAVA